MTRDARNPPGLDGFQFAEFAGPDPGATKALFEQLGCFAVSRHATKAVARYNEGPSTCWPTRNPPIRRSNSAPPTALGPTA